MEIYIVVHFLKTKLVCCEPVLSRALEIRVSLVMCLSKCVVIFKFFNNIVMCIGINIFIV